MPSRVDQGSEQTIDRNTCASIRNAIGERLRQNLVPAADALPSHLQALLDHMQRQERDSTIGS